MAAQAVGPAHGCLPCELAELVTAHLSPFTRHSLFIASRTFGQQPTEELVTRLCLNIDELDLGGAHDTRRLSRLSRLKHLQLGTSAAAAADDATYGQLSQTVVLLTTHVPTMRRLTRLDLTSLPLSFLVAAASCLAAAAPPSLASLYLRDVGTETVGGLSQLWPALARIAPLRSLQLDSVGGVAPAGDWKGLSALSQLQTLKINTATMALSSLPAMPGLTQLCVTRVGAPAAAAVPATCLAGCDNLQELSIVTPTDGNIAALGSVSWATLTALTSLSLIGWDLLLKERPHALAQHWGGYTALVRLAIHYALPEYTLLLALPSLVELTCVKIDLPAVGAGVQLLSMGSITLTLGFECGWDDDDEQVVPQSVADTFPRLASLSLQPPSPDDEMPTARQLWPAGPSGSMLHLRSLATSGECVLPLALAEAAVALQTLCLSDTASLSAERRGPDLLPALRLVGRHLLHATLAGPEEDVGVDDDSICTVLDCWPHVRTVHVAGSSALTSIGVARLSHADCLRSVTLEECSAVTASGVAALAARRSVEHLKVVDCDRVTLDEVRGIQRMVGRPQLTIDFPGL